MTKQERLAANFCILELLEIVSEEHNGIKDKRRIMKHLKDLMTRNYTEEELENRIILFVNEEE